MRIRIRILSFILLGSGFQHWLQGTIGSENYISQISVVQKEKTGEKQKILPLTLDMMKVVNERFSLQADCGGIAGTCVFSWAWIRISWV